MEINVKILIVSFIFLSSYCLLIGRSEGNIPLASSPVFKV
jgi:hypothetical protein